MTNLMEVRDALILVILTYHRKRISTDNPKSDQELLADLLAKPHAERIESLNGLIDQISKSIETRTPLLNYIMHGIDLFKVFEGWHEPVDEDILGYIQKELINLVLDFKRLLNLSHRYEVDVIVGGTELKLYGFLNGLFSRSYCISGGLVNELVMAPLKLTPASSQQEIESTLKLLVANKQRDLKNEFLEKEKLTLVQEMRSLKNDKSVLIAEKEALQEELRLLKETKVKISEAPKVGKKKEEVKTPAAVIPGEKSTLSYASLFKRAAIPPGKHLSLLTASCLTSFLDNQQSPRIK